MNDKLEDKLNELINNAEGYVSVSDLKKLVEPEYALLTYGYVPFGNGGAVIQSMPPGRVITHGSVKATKQATKRAVLVQKLYNYQERAKDILCPRFVYKPGANNSYTHCIIGNECSVSWWSSNYDPLRIYFDTEENAKLALDMNFTNGDTTIRELMMEIAKMDGVL